MSREADRFTWLALAAVAAAAVGLAACGTSAPAGAASVGPLQVDVSQLWITVTNTSSSPLTDVRVTVQVSSREFTATYARLEPGQRREFNYSALRARDGTPFNRQIHKPRGVLVTATDATKQTHTIELPWG
jgi:hypothetical protein